MAKRKKPKPFRAVTAVKAATMPMLTNVRRLMEERKPELIVDLVSSAQLNYRLRTDPASRTAEVRAGQLRR